jgi:hypothetical protein
VLELSFGVADTSGMLSSSPSRWDAAAVSRAAARRFDLTRSDIFVSFFLRSKSVLTFSVLRVVDGLLNGSPVGVFFDVLRVVLVMSLALELRCSSGVP